MKKNNNKGFTLIEIIMVIVILAVLMAVAVPSVLKYVDTAQEAPALTECNAVVTASQKRVIDKYAQSKNDNISLNDDDNKWIMDFVDVDGKIQGTISVTDKEVVRVLYKASNGLYVLYDKTKSPEYSIISEEEVKKTIAFQLSSLVSEYTTYTKDLYEANKIALNCGREEIIKKLVEEKGLSKVQEELKEKIGSKVDLYWKPYYLGTTKDPSIVLFANDSQTNHGAWRTSIVFVNGQLYSSPSNTSITNYNAYKTPQELQTYLDSQPKVYTKMN